MSTKNIVFSHANGFPAKSYLKFFDFLEDYKISYIDAIGLKSKTVGVNWKNSVNELIEFIEENFDEPVIGLGHSFGGVLNIFASAKRPDLFEKVIVIDPPLFGPKKRYAVGAFRLLGQEDRVYRFPRMARIRKSHFLNVDEAHDYFKKRPFFRNFHPESLEHYATYGTTQNGEGVELLISPHLESEIFRLMPCFFSKELLRPKNCYFLYALKKGAHDKGDIKWLKKSLQNTEFLGFEGGHMMPLESPQKMSEIILPLMGS